MMGNGAAHVAFGIKEFELLLMRSVKGWLRVTSKATLPMSCG